MNVPKLLRTALFSVLALVLTVGLAVSPVQAQPFDASVTVDPSVDDDINVRLSDLDDAVNSAGGKTGELRILADNYEADGEISLDADDFGDSGGSLDALEDLTITAVDNNGNTTVTIESIEYEADGGVGLTNVTVRSDGANLRLTTNSANSSDALRLNGDGTDGTFDVESSGVLRIDDGLRVERDDEISITGEQIEYRGNGTADLTFVTDGNDISADQELPRTSGDVGTLELDEGTGTNGTVTFSSFGFSVNTIQDGNTPSANPGETGTSFTVEGDLTVDSDGLAGDDGTEEVTVKGDFTVNGGGVSDLTTLAVESGGNLDVTGQLGVGDGTFTVATGGTATVTASTDPVIDVEDGSFNTNGGSLTVTDNGSGDAIEVTDTNSETTLNAGATTISGSANPISVDGSSGNGAIVTLGDVTFDVAFDDDTAFDLTGTNADVTVDGADGVTIDVFGDDNDANKGTLVTGGGSFTSTNGVELTPDLEGATTTDGDVVDLNVNVTEPSADFDIGSVTANSATDSDNGNEVSTALDIDAVGTSGDDIAGEVTAGGTVRTLDNAYAENGGTDDAGGTITLTGGTVTGQLTNAAANGTSPNASAAGGTVNVTGDVTYSSGKNVINFATDGSDAEGQIDVQGTDTELLITGNADIVNHGTNGVTGEGLLAFNSDGNDLTVQANNGNDLPDVEARSDLGSLDIQGTADDDLDIGDLTAKSPVTIVSGGADAADVTVDGNLDADAQVDFGDGSATLESIDVNGFVTADSPIDFGNSGDAITATASTDDISIDGKLTANDAVTFGASKDGSAGDFTISTSDVEANANVDFGSGADQLDVGGELLVDNGTTTIKNLGTKAEAQDVTIDGETAGDNAKLDLGDGKLVVTRDFARKGGAANADFATGGSATLKIGGTTAESTVQSPTDRLRVDGDLEFEKEAVEGDAPITVQDVVRVDGDVTVIEPTNSLAFTEVTFEENLIVDNGTFSVTRNSGSSSLETSGAAVVFRNGADVDPGTEGLTINGDILSRDDGARTDISGSAALNVTGKIEMRSGGFNITSGASLNPGEKVIRFITDADAGGNPATQIVGDGDFNPNDNTYNLEYRGSGSEQNTGSELDGGNVADLDVGPPDRETGQLPGTEIDLAGSPEITGALTVRSGARINDDNDGTDRTITLSAAQTTHNVTGTVEGANEDVTLRIEGEESSVEGTTEDEAATIESLVAAASGVEVTNIQDITGSVDVLADFDDGGTTVEPDLTLTLADDPSNGGKEVAGDITAKNPLTLGSAVEASTDGNVKVLAAGSDENGTLNFGGFDLTLSDGSVTFTSESEATFNAPSGGTLLFSGAADVNAGGATIPNVTFDGGVTVGENATVSNSLKINTGITLGGDPAELTFQSDATLAGDVTTAGTGPEALVADGGALTVSGSDRAVDEYVAASGTDGEARVELPEDETNALTFDKRFEIASGDFTHAAEVIVDAAGNAIDFNTGTDAGSISQEGENDLVLNGDGKNSITFDLAGPLTAGRVSVEGANVAYGDTENFTVSRLDLNQAFDFGGGDGSLVIADGGTVIRDSDSDVLNEALSFAGSEDTYDLEYTSDDPRTSGHEFATAGRVKTLDVNISDGSTLTLDDTDVGTNAQVNTEIKLTEGTVEHGDASNSERQLALNENGTLIQQDGELDGTIQVNGSEAYTLRYQPTDGNISTSGGEFLDQSSDPSIALQLRAENPDDPDSDNITLHADRSVASLSASRQSSNSEFDLDGNTLTVDGNTTVSSGEVRNSSGDLAEIDGQGFAVEGGTIDGDGNGGVALTSSSGTFEVTDGEVEGSDIDADGAFEATGGTLDGISLAAAGDAEITEDATLEEKGATNNNAGEVTIEFDGSGNQNFKVEGDETIDNISVNQSGSTVTVSDVSNSDTEVSVAGTLTLENGILVSNEQDVAQGENPVEFDLTGGTIDRNVADGDASHIAGPVTQTIGTGDGAEALYPVGTADGTYRQFRLFFPNGLSSNADVTVEHENQDPEGTSGFPLTSNFSDGSQGTFNLSQDYPSYYWRVETGSPTSLQQDYEVFVRADGFEFGPGGADEDDEPQFRIIRRTDTDPQQVDSDWSLVGSGTNYDNLLQGDASLDTRTTAATQSLNTQGSRFTVTSPQKPKPVIATNDELPIAIGSKVAIDQSSLETTDSDNTPSELTYTVTTAPTQGELLLSGSAVGEGGTFTQQDINDGNVEYSHTADPVDDDNFEFEVSDNADQTTSGTFSIDVQAAPTIATNTGLSLTQGNQVPVQTGDLEVTDEDNAASELTYEITTAPSQGELLLSGSAVGEGGTFTQQDINDGNVEYNHTADPVDDDNFEFEVSDTDGRSVTGTVNVTVNAAEFAISGTVVHPRTDGDSDPVEGATVTINDSDGNVVATPETGTDGSYSTDVAEGNYTLEVTAVDGVPETPSDDGLASGLSVNSTDAFVAQDNFLGSATLSPIQTTVGDVTGSEDVVNTTDAFDIQGYFLDAIENELDVGVLSGGTESVDVSGGDETGIQLEAVAFGDINLNGDLNGAADGSGTQVASAISASTAGEESVSLVGPESDTRTTAATSSVSAEDTETTFEVPVRLDRPAELGAFDLTMSYDSEKATLQGVSAPNAEVSSSSEDGTVRLAWFDKKGGQNPLTVSDGGKLVTLTFKADADVKKGETFDLEDIEGQLTGPNAESLSGVGLTVPQVSFGIERPDEFALEGNAPNPFQSRTTLSVQMPESGSATVSVYNTLGQQVKEIQTNLAAGDDQRIEVDGSGLSSGVYMYRIEVEMESKTIRRSGRMTLVK